MTDAAAPVTAKPRRPGAGSAPALTWLAALTVFAAVLILLAWRMLAGDDPALGAPQPQAAAAAPAKHVIVRRIIRRTIVVTSAARAADGGAPASAGAPVAAAPRTRVGAAPAPAAPAAAPAPVTRSS